MEGARVILESRRTHLCIRRLFVLTSRSRDPSQYRLSQPILEQLTGTILRTPSYFTLTASLNSPSIPGRLPTPSSALLKREISLCHFLSIQPCGRLSGAFKGNWRKNLVSSDWNGSKKDSRPGKTGNYIPALLYLLICAIIASNIHCVACGVHRPI